MPRSLVTALAIATIAVALALVASRYAGDGPDVAVAPNEAPGCARPYSASSPWNRPIGSSPKVDPRSAVHVRALGGPLTSDPTQYTYPVYEVPAGTPLQRVRVDNLFTTVSGGGRQMVVRKGPTVSIPIPPAARAAAGSDAQIIIVDRRTGYEYGVWRARREAGGWRVENGSRYNIRWSGVPPRGDPPFTSRGAGVPYLAGLVRPCEIARGRIDHALAFAYDYPTDRHVYPATKSDGDSRDPRDLPEGARLQLDPRLTAADLSRRGCTGPCLTIARALQRYGMYVIDNSGRPKVMLEYQDTARWRGVDAKTVSPIPMRSFRVVGAR